MKNKWFARFRNDNGEGKTKRKRKIKPKWIVGGLIVIAVVLFLVFRPSDRMPDNLVSRMDLTELLVTDLEYAIHGTGTVESNQSNKVYAGQNYRIEDVLVAVGDMVSVGQPLLVLDTGTLKDQIETKEISMTAAERSAAQQIKTANDNYLAAKKAIDSGTNSSLISAESSVRTAYENWQRAIKTYDDYVASKNNGSNATLLAQDSQVNSTKLARDQGQSTLDSARGERESAANARNQAQAGYNAALAIQQGLQAALDLAIETLDEQAIEDAQEALDAAVQITKAAEEGFNAATVNLTAKGTALTSAERAFEQAQSSYDAAVKSRNAAYKTADTTLQDYAKNIETTKAAYETALRSQTAAEEAAKNALQQNLNNLSTAQLNASTELSDLEYERMLRNLADAQVTAKEAGTITAIYATIGNVASGILFVIEDTNDLVIETTISEFDVGTITVGMPVAIQSEATKETIYDGTVISIAPTSNKNVQGNTDKMGDVVFATKIKVNDADTDLRIGMSVRLSFIVERQENILAVPYDAVYANDAGVECVMILAESGNSFGEAAYELREIPVMAGLENDINIVISGNGIKEGITVINTPSNYQNLVGRAVILTDQIISGNSGMRGMMFGF